ncbi:MAG: 3-phosphoshikimate 1-carboxyvinyltransferase [Planctomycetes bacterium]|nr:3-phosphoshikimate 1-carboxyvinyltransferase [Planctomycetota bacterium]
MIDYTLPLDELPDPLPIEPLTKPFDVTITPPGSKSITCRAYVLAALAEGESKIIRPLRADDTDKLLDALCTLGAEARWEGEDVFIKGVGGRFPRGGEVNLGDGGTPARFMIACACLAAETVVVDGSPRMRKRPVAEGVDMLQQLGATIEYVEKEGRLPVRVLPSDDFKGGELEIGKTQSSQFISALLLIGSSLPAGITVRYIDHLTSSKYVKLTLTTMRKYGIKIGSLLNADNHPKEDQVVMQRLRGSELGIPPDASSAAYWFTAAALIPDSTIRIPQLGYWNVNGQLVEIAQPDIEILKAFDVDELLFNEEFVGFTSLSSKDALSLDASAMPDGAIALSVYAANANNKSTISGLHTLRIKETDRIAALANELTKIGCSVETTDDSISIVPPHRHDARATEEKPVIIETYNDHRMAMAFAVLGLARPGISIRNPKCVAKSYPGFWKDFARLYA